MITNFELSRAVESLGGRNGDKLATFNFPGAVEKAKIYLVSGYQL